MIVQQTVVTPTRENGSSDGVLLVAQIITRPIIEERGQMKIIEIITAVAPLVL